MSKNTELEQYQNLIMNNGVAHLTYQASNIHDIIHPLSIPGEELLSDTFCIFLEKYRDMQVYFKSEK